MIRLHTVFFWGGGGASTLAKPAMNEAASLSLLGKEQRDKSTRTPACSKNKNEKKATCVVSVRWCFNQQRRRKNMESKVGRLFAIVLNSFSLFYTCLQFNHYNERKKRRKKRCHLVVLLSFSICFC